MKKRQRKIRLIRAGIQLLFFIFAPALFSTASGFFIIPHLSIHSYAAGLKQLPEVIFELEIPQIMSVMSALVFRL